MARIARKNTHSRRSPDWQSRVKGRKHADLLRKSARRSDPSTPIASNAEPSGVCGSDSDRDARTGRFISGNRASLVVGQSSQRFWSAADEARREISAAVIADAGHTLNDAPRALRIACDGLAQATLVRDSAFSRLVESGGPTTGDGRTRRVFNTWASACERVDRCLRLVGLQRRPKDPPSIHDWLAEGDDEPHDPSTDAPNGGNSDEQSNNDAATRDDEQGDND